MGRSLIICCLASISFFYIFACKIFNYYLIIKVMQKKRMREAVFKVSKKIPLSHFRLIKKATMNDFEDISVWLKDAFENHKELYGYRLYYNLNGFIHEAFKEQNVFVLRYKDKAVAFLAFSPPYEEGIRIKFDAVCVKPNFLRMGLATYLHESAIEYFRKRGYLVAELYDVCTESYKLGRSMGFVKKEENKETSIVSMVKILVETRKQNRNANIRFVVWDNCYADINTQPIYSWSLNFRRDKKPIIRSIDAEWTVGIIKGKKVVIHGIAKRFLDVVKYGGPYLYINEEKAKYIIESIHDYI